MEMTGKANLKSTSQKNVDKMINFRPKIGQDATFAPIFNLHNSAIFLSDFDIWPRQNDYLGKKKRLALS